VDNDVYAWSRWLLLNITTPSGKMLFVCRFCGHLTPAPSSCPDRSSNDGFKYLFGLKCEEFEKVVVDIRKKKLSEHHKAMYAEDCLKPHGMRWCNECHGWGCHQCAGSGLAFFDFTSLIREIDQS
jgi:hypothetical protein